MKRHDLLLALNGIINVVGDPDAADLMLDFAEALRDRVKAEPEPLVVMDDLMYTFRNSGMSRVWVHFPMPPGVSEGSETPVTVTVTRKP